MTHRDVKKGNCVSIGKDGLQYKVSEDDSLIYFGTGENGLKQIHRLDVTHVHIKQRDGRFKTIQLEMINQY